MAGQPRLKLALIGLGRLGSIRARILTSQQPRIELVAVCDTRPDAQAWAETNLPPTTRFFADPTECLEKSGAQAVLISTGTATHPPLISGALVLGLHVMCEKPISVDLTTTQEIIAAAKAKPHLKFLVPFCRRFDESYRAAKSLADNGSLGKIHAVESTCLDRQDPTGFFVTFSSQSGGIFLDMGVHDIDMGRWFLDVKSGISNPKKQVTRVVAMGQTAVYSDLSQYGDCDNGWGLIEFANGTVLTVHVGRTLTNGHEGTTRIHGTKGHTIVNGNSNLNRVEIRDAHGVRMETTPDPFVLYEKSFLNDLAEFAAAVLDGAPLTCTPDDAFEAAKIGTALQCSFRTGVPVYFDDEGMPVLEPAIASQD